MKAVEISLDANSSYMMRLVNENLNYKGILVELYDEKGIKLATNFVNDKYYNGWSYKTKDGGRYIVKFITDEKAKPFQATLSKRKNQN
ncbi:hypothetical protein [Thermoflexibacter ruber]|uniref:Uncharacterized protein n=1 Tax=Thermoflexibacter ruber TaxID=1003 RepID=A0A1I2AJF8_9BACT|nr:hypothetical protein [Thermoflexibacter ruber]SFE43847.1 hypothetical protein SAMN04488541_1001190 [Thermoflexibacter ruber]